MLSKRCVPTQLTVIVVLVALVAVWSLLVRRVEGQTLSPYSEFQAMSASNLATLQVKLTYVGPTLEKFPTVVFSTTSNPVNVGLFKPFRRSGINYSSDDAPPFVTFSATPQELQSIITNVATLPNVTAGTVASPSFLSFSLLNTSPSTKVFEAIVNATDAGALMDQLRASLANNKAALLALESFACPLDLVPAATAVDMTSSTSVAISGTRLVRATGRFVATATVTNTSGATLPAPLSLVVIPQGASRLGNLDGTTCKTSPQGAPFINLSTSTLGAGQSVTVTLEFDNPDRQVLAPTTKVLAGPGGR